ncbi:sodium/sulphate symporter [Lucifera butyrica]|uniref:Sodium/sulphate symporter n=1 Tax=Lucifera butyrica TaxID=1351585 RepID=A0A498RD77_9FIRM|nr:anion permease [Lucifera butyrica]VBB08867.1 sodium/sulphate symporter [Lucifera butyrica]
MNKKLIDGFITISVGIILWLLPVPSGLTQQAWHLFAVFVATILGFILQPLPMGAVAFISISFAVTSGLLQLSQALSGFSDSTIWLIVAAFTFARGFIKTGLGRRIAFQFMKIWGGNTLFLAYSMVATDLVMSIATPSNTARAGGVIFPIARSLCNAFDSHPGPTARKFGAFLMQTVYQCNGVTSAMFMTAMAGNPLCVVLAKQTLNINISWFGWALAASVPGIIALIVIPLVIYLVYPPEITETPEAKTMAKQALAEMGPMSAAEKVLMIVFFGAVALWISAGLQHMFPEFPFPRMSATAVALLGVAVMLLTNVLAWRDIIEEGGAWDTLIWMGSIVALAKFLAYFGFIPWFAATVSASISHVAWIPALFILTVLYLYSQYAFASLTAHITALYSVFLALAYAAGAPPVLTALVFAFSSSLCMSLTHYAAGPAPIFYNAGYVSQVIWWRIGFIVSVINIIIWVGLGSIWWKAIGLW